MKIIEIHDQGKQNPNDTACSIIERNLNFYLPYFFSRTSTSLICGQDLKQFVRLSSRLNIGEIGFIIAFIVDHLSCGWFTG